MPKKLTPAMQQYFDFKEQHKDAVLFFQMGDFFEMFGDEAEEVSRLLDITLTTRNKGSENALAMCGVPLKAAPGYIAKLTEAGRKVAICEQVTAPTGKGVVEREVTRIVTPGTTFDESLLEQKKSNFLCAIHFDKKQSALGIVDITTGEFRVGIFESIESLLDEVHRVQPSEILIEDSNHPISNQVEDYAYLAPFSLPSWQDPQKLIRDHFGTIGLESFGIEDSDILQRLTASLLSYLQETQKSSLGHIRKVERFHSGDSMLLDEATMRNLELFASQQTGKPEGSLIGVIDQTLTSMGGRLLRWWLAHPFIEEEKIQERLNAVDAFLQHPESFASVRAELKNTCDLERLVGKVGTMRANPRDFYHLKETLLKLPVLKEALSPLLESSLLIKHIDDQIQEQNDLISLIQKTIAEEPPILLAEGGYIADGLDQELDDLRKIASSGKDWINELQAKEQKRTGVASLKIKFNKVFGYYIEISHANKDKVPDDYIRKQTLVNAERYITPELKEYEEKVLGAEDKILIKEQELFQKLREQVYEYLDQLQNIARALAMLDVLGSFAHQAKEYRYSKPELVKVPVLSIKEGRHPVIESISGEVYIPNDLEMKKGQSFHLITGPNMSGKSSFLRQNALIVLLAQIGSYVPASEMKWSVVDRIFTRVGASDNLARGRSTFMVEMQEAGYILNHATEKSLIILDELGRGTSTYDGLSLAWAITEYLHDIAKAKTLFATHYHELIEIVETLPDAKNYSVSVSEENEEVVFLHKVLEGGISKSYGIEVAKLAGLPHSLVLRAKDILATLEKHAWEKDQSPQPSLPLMPVIESAEHPAIVRLKEIDPDQLTPMEALKLLDELKREVD